MDAESRGWGGAERSREEACRAVGAGRTRVDLITTAKEQHAAPDGRTRATRDARSVLECGWEACVGARSCSSGGLLRGHLRGRCEPGRRYRGR